MLAWPVYVDSALALARAAIISDALGVSNVVLGQALELSGAPGDDGALGEGARVNRPLAVPEDEPRALAQGQPMLREDRPQPRRDGTLRRPTAGFIPRVAG